LTKAELETRCLILTSRPIPRQLEARPNLDFVSRVFCPRCGVAEDPVTGSAHCALAYHYGNKLNKFVGSGSAEGETLKARQVSLRGGDLELLYNKETGRVELRGSAVAVAEGRLLNKP
jgi:predicted PhzF superfamily epimerase YddE/YHI9